MKIFRDLIWLMRGIMKADHQFYKANGEYDFPQKQRGKMMGMCVLGAMVRNPRMKAKMGNKFNQGMAAPYEKVVAKAVPAGEDPAEKVSADRRKIIAVPKKTARVVRRRRK